MGFLRIECAQFKVLGRGASLVFMVAAYCATVGKDLDPRPHISNTHVKGHRYQLQIT
jgi:hypothetical protein